ncbi:hypothetical protein GCM10020295_71920 [Streptomyces cinereospinus]
MARDGARPAYDPAGPDAGLRTALQELRAGRWMSMRTLLAETTSWSLWTGRTQVLAAAAAGTDVVRTWLAEEPHSVPAVVMHARVAVERALRAARGDHRRTQELWHEAWRAADTAARASPTTRCRGCACWRWPGWTPSSAGRSTGSRRRSRCCRPARGGLLAEAGKRDPHNREAHHRMLQFLFGRAASGRLAEAVGFAQWAADGAPPGSALHVLPLYVRVERYRRAGGSDAALDLHWVAEDATREARRAFHFWFELTTAAERSPLDLNHLAHALWGALQFPEAARVFDAIGPYYAPLPWAHRASDPSGHTAAVDVFLQARGRSTAHRP